MNMLVASRPLGFLLILLVVTAMIAQGHRREPMPSLLFSTSNAKTNTNIMQSSKLSLLMRSILKLRGGEDVTNESDEEEQTDDESDEEEQTDDESDEERNDELSSAIDYAAVVQKVVDVTKGQIFPVIAKYSQKSALRVKKTSVTIYHALRRGISAALEGEEAEESDDSDDEDIDEEDTTVMDKIIAISKQSISIMKRMVKAALTVPEEDEKFDEIYEQSDEVTSEPIEESKKDEEEIQSQTIEDEPINADSSATKDFGSYLAEAYGVDDERTTRKAGGHTILGGSLKDALQTARQQARMLLAFIPSEQPKIESGRISLFGGGKKFNPESFEKDRTAIQSLLSKEVGKAANRKAQKVKDSGNDFGSFIIWGGKAGSSEATSTIKQLKVKDISAKGEKRPIMCVVYPAVASVGSDKIVPQVLAQHHCNPPLKAESMTSWMNALRKRHKKQYERMQTDVQEQQLFQERKEGYIDSVHNDKERRLKKAQEEADQKAQEIKEAARQAEIDARRQELQQSLPEDIKNGSNVKKIGLRFSDGRTGQRGFMPDQPLRVVFDWVDAMFEIERETVVLTTLNGKQSFSWDDDETKNGTLEDAGLKKMTAFRVTEA